MNALLFRVDGDEHRTLGVLVIDGFFFCYALEDTVRSGSAKVPGLTAVPAGRYPFKLTISARAQAGTLWTPDAHYRLPQLMDVPGFEGVRAHAGSKATDTRGCVLVGQERGVDELANSRPALIRLVQHLDLAERAGLSSYLSIENKF